MSEKEIKIWTNFQLVASQVLGEFYVGDEYLWEYSDIYKKKIMEFESFREQHVPREHNTDQDIYSLKTSTHPNKCINNTYSIEIEHDNY